MNFPADLKYTKDHEWIRVEGDFAMFAYAGGQEFLSTYVKVENMGVCPCLNIKIA